MAMPGENDVGDWRSAGWGGSRSCGCCPILGQRPFPEQDRPGSGFGLDADQI